MIRVEQLRLQAFRAYPASREFPFPDAPGGSILLFAPNGYGKSSITDAFEFLLSPESTLERLGVRDAEMNSGRKPLRNTRSAPDIKTLVELKIIGTDGSRSSGFREARETPTPIPEEITEFASARVVDFLVRGPDLRNLVYATTPRKHYDELARCLNAERLTTLQADIRSLELSIKRDAEQHERKLQNLDRQITTLTDAFVTTWDNAKVVTWLGNLLSPQGIALGSLDLLGSTASKLEGLAANEISSILQQQFRSQTDRIDAALAQNEDGRLRFLESLDVLSAAARRRDVASQRAAQAASLQTIDQAIILLERPDQYLESCPICGTKYIDSPYGSRDGVIKHLHDVQRQLTELHSAEAAFSSAKAKWDAAVVSFGSRLTLIAESCNAHAPEIRAAWDACTNHLERCSEEGVSSVVSILKTCQAEIASRLDSTRAPKFGPLLEKTKKILELRAAYEVWRRVKSKRDRVAIELGEAKTLIDKEVHSFITAAVASIESDVISFYSAVQQFAVVPVRIHMSLMDSANADARGLELLIDFPDAPNAKPRAYLSDSQINTLGLGLRLALIRQFNPSLAFAVLDDVVTSYDADYRRQIVKVLLRFGCDMQLVILTHDEQFMREMRERIEGDNPARWRVRQIKHYAPDIGPEFVDAPTNESEIEAKLNQGELAANLIRRYLERRLFRIGEEIGARVPLRQNAEYANRELIDAVVAASKTYGFDDLLARDPELRSTVSELQQNAILNQGSHAVNNPYRSGSLGDERSLWEDIKKFVSVFRCSTCQKRRFKFHPEQNKASCTDCGTYLNLSA